MSKVPFILAKNPTRDSLFLHVPLQAQNISVKCRGWKPTQITQSQRGKIHFTTSVQTSCCLRVDIEPPLHVTASAKRLLRNNGVEELISWIWSGTNHHDISPFYLLRAAGPEEGQPSNWMLSGLIPVCNC